MHLGFAVDDIRVHMPMLLLTLLPWYKMALQISHQSCLIGEGEDKGEETTAAFSIFIFQESGSFCIPLLPRPGASTVSHGPELDSKVILQGFGRPNNGRHKWLKSLAIVFF